MIYPGNIRERPRVYHRADINCRVIDNVMALCTETIELQSSALDLLGNSCLEGGAAFEVLDRLSIARAEIDMVSRIIKRTTGHEIHDSH